MYIDYEAQDDNLDQLAASSEIDADTECFLTELLIDLPHYVTYDVNANIADAF